MSLEGRVRGKACIWDQSLGRDTDHQTQGDPEENKGRTEAGKETHLGVETQDDEERQQLLEFEKEEKNASYCQVEDDRCIGNKTPGKEINKTKGT